MGFPGGSVGKESACNAGDPGSNPGSGRSVGEGTGYPLQYSWASLVAQLVKNLPAMWETWEDPLEKGRATHSSILAWKIPWTVLSIRSQRMGHDWACPKSVHGWRGSGLLGWQRDGAKANLLPRSLGMKTPQNPWYSASPPCSSRETRAPSLGELSPAMGMPPALSDRSLASCWVGSEPHQLAGNTPQSWSATWRDMGPPWPPQGTVYTGGLSVVQAPPDLPGLMRCLSDGGSRHVEASDAHPERGARAEEGVLGGGSVPGCAGVLAVLSLRGWSPAIPFLMAAPGPRRDALYAGASGTGDLRKCIAHHSQDREEDRTLINMSSHIASTLSPTPGGWTDVFHVFMT